MLTRNLVIFALVAASASARAAQRVNTSGVNAIGREAADLGAAWRAGDVTALRRAGAAETGEVAAALRGGDPAAVLGATVAAEAAPDAWELLEPLAVVAGGWDRRLAAPAARAAARISRGLDADAAILLDLPDDRLDAIGQAWEGLARRADRWSDVRVHALEVATRVARARAATAEGTIDDSAGLLAAAGDADPQLRRAALELMPVPVPAALHAPLAARVASDADPGVRLAAAQALCAALPADAPAVLAALGAPGLDALRATLLESGIAGRADNAAAVLDAARCLVADDDPRSRRELARLRHAAPRPVRAALGKLK